ncbi:hypothetical protein NX059_003986 [Plenodomus lindquistii]|nr:hypothetical protein NX059_003986 [Plenodomus lindquistii]
MKTTRCTNGRQLSDILAFVVFRQHVSVSASRCRKQPVINMESKVQDYYDMPVDLLPSANFAGRPMSELAMLDGLYTMIISSSSSSDDEDDEEGPTTPGQHSLHAAETRLIGPDTRPHIEISSPTRKDLKPRLRSLSNDVKMMERPRLRKKANTAPGGTIPLMDVQTLQPRRAISTLFGTVGEGDEIDGVRNGDDDNTTAGTTIKRTFSDAKSRPPQRPLPPIPVQKDVIGDMGNRESRRRSGSFSQKLRVQKTLQQKQMEMLRTDTTDHNSRRAPNSANSMMATPRELYAIPEKQATHDAEPEPHITQDAPSDMDSSHSRKRRSTRSISPASASPGTQSLAQVRAHVSGTTKTNSVSLSRSPRTYVPGAICFEEHPAMPRRDSVATLDPFDRPQHKTNRFSDLIVQDAIIMFFDDLGVMEDATEASLDRYWLDESRGYTIKDDEQEAAWRRPSFSSVTELTPMSPKMAPSLRRSRFSSSSASSITSSTPVDKSPRTRLGRLLSPTGPGIAFLRAPGLFEKQAKKWQTRNESG